MSPPDSHCKVPDPPEVRCPGQGAEGVIVDGVAVEHRVLSQVPRGRALIIVVISGTLGVVSILTFSVLNRGLSLDWILQDSNPSFNLINRKHYEKEYIFISYSFI